MSDLIKEIDEAEINVLYVAQTCHEESVCREKLKSIELTLQRVRDALTWKPIDYGKMDHRKPFLFKMRDESYRTWDVRVDEIVDKYYYEDVIEPEYSHYIEIPPFNEGKSDGA